MRNRTASQGRATRVAAMAMLIMAVTSSLASAADANTTAPSELATDAAGSQQAPATGTAPVTAATTAATQTAAGVDAIVAQAALAVFQVLEKHCSRCHQQGRLKRQKPAKNFGNILELDEIARDPNLIQPGNPDASRLYNQMVKREMPYDVFNEFSGGEEPSAEEIATVREWITSLGAKASVACAGRTPIGNAAVVEAIAADIEAELPQHVAGLRYVTLNNLFNSCASDQELDVYRSAAVKLLNSLSRNSDALKLRTIDPAKTIIKFHLEDIGWEASDWELVLSRYPYAALPDQPRFKFIAAATHTELPFVRGDFLAFAAARPPLYHDLLHLPKTFGELQRILHLDVASDIEKFLVQRAGFQVSGVSRNNRLIERHTISTGVFWTSYDFAQSAGVKNLFEHPLGPGGKDGFQPDGGESIFSLPNGFNAYYLSTAKGDRIDQGPTKIVQDTTQKDLSVTNGISCIGCHDQGFRKAKDDIRARVVGDRSFSKSVRDAVEALYPLAPDMDASLAGDTDGFRSAMQKAGLDADLKLNGIEAVNALSKQYEKDVDLAHAAAELSISGDNFAKLLEGAGGEVFRLGRRLQQGVVPREAFETGFKDLLVQVSDDGFATVALGAAKAGTGVTGGSEAPKFTRDFELSLISDKTGYAVNDLATFTVRAKQNCYLTLINVSTAGEGTVIFPNEFQRDDFLRAGKELQVPGKKAPFQLRLKDKGVETVVAVCNTNARTAHGIKHDYKEMSFTALGNYNAYITRSIKAQKTAAQGSASGSGNKSTKKAGGLIARTAIKLQVK